MGKLLKRSWLTGRHLCSSAFCPHFVCDSWSFSSHQGSSYDDLKEWWHERQRLGPLVMSENHLPGLGCCLWPFLFKKTQLLLCYSHLLCLNYMQLNKTLAKPEGSPVFPLTWQTKKSFSDSGTPSSCHQSASGVYHPGDIFRSQTLLSLLVLTITMTFWHSQCDDHDLFQADFITWLSKFQNKQHFRVTLSVLKEKNLISFPRHLSKFLCSSHYTNTEVIK